MSVAATTPTATCTCWCEATEVVIPVEFIDEGRTVPCDLPDCEPGCPSRAYDAFELEYPEETEATEPTNRKRIIVIDYDPAEDSSPGTAHLRPGYDGLLLIEHPNQCGCGCTGTRRAKSQFLPGHDAKLKGKLQRAMAAEIPVHLIGSDHSVRRTTPEALAEHYGQLSGKDWLGIVAKGADRIRRRSATPVAAEKRLARIVEDGRSDATLEQFSRWEKTGRAMAMWRLADGSLEIQYVTTEGTIETFAPNTEGESA